MFDKLHNLIKWLLRLLAPSNILYMKKGNLTLRKKCPYSKLFSPNAGKYEPEQSK